MKNDLGLFGKSTGYGQHNSAVLGSRKLKLINGIFVDEETGSSFPNLAVLRPDKCLLAEEFRELAVAFRSSKNNGDRHEDRHLLFFTEDMFEQERMVFLPAVPWLSVNLEKIPIPIWMFRFFGKQKNVVIREAAKLGIGLTERDFIKPALSLDSRCRFEFDYFMHEYQEN